MFPKLSLNSLELILDDGGEGFESSDVSVHLTQLDRLLEGTTLGQELQVTVHLLARLVDDVGREFLGLVDSGRGPVNETFLNRETTVFN